MSEIQAFAELPNSRWLARFLRCVPPVDNNRKWRTALEPEKLIAFDQSTTGERHRALARN